MCRSRFGTTKHTQQIHHILVSLMLQQCVPRYMWWNICHSPARCPCVSGDPMGSGDCVRREGPMRPGETDHPAVRFIAKHPNRRKKMALAGSMQNLASRPCPLSQARLAAVILSSFRRQQAVAVTLYFAAIDEGGGTPTSATTCDRFFRGSVLGGGPCVCGVVRRDESWSAVSGWSWTHTPTQPQLHDQGQKQQHSSHQRVTAHTQAQR